MSNLHRQTNFWEPTFNPKGSPLSKEFCWSTIENNNGPNECICEGEDLRHIKTNKIIQKKFTTCDFKGNYYFDKTFSFKDCEFQNCHFGRSNWQNVKFQDCMFESSAFSITQFERCQFIGCRFKNISVSANETIFNKCLLKASMFVKNVQTNLKHPGVLSERGTTPEYQKYRLAQSKAKIAKNILLSVKEYGDENLFINAIKTFSMHYNSGRLIESAYFIKSGKFSDRIKHLLFIVPRVIEYVLIFLFGTLNRWGYSIGRITLIGLVVWLSFSLVYYLQTLNISESLIKSFDILTLVGYSKYDIDTFNMPDKVIHLLNLLAGISWFSLFFPTILARTSNRFE